MPYTNAKRIDKSNYQADKTDLGQQVAALTLAVRDLHTIVTALATNFNAHSHRADGTKSGQYTTTAPVTEASEVTGGTARTVATVSAATPGTWV